MKHKELWKFPVPSTCISDGGVQLFYPGGDAWLLFDYYDQDHGVNNSGILFKNVQAHRHSSEVFLEQLMPGVYDTLCEITDSEWIAYLRKVNKQIADFWNIKHYAIFLDSNGLYEFVAKDFEILKTKEGGIDGLFKIE